MTQYSTMNGFSLIEIIATLAFIAILTTIALANMSPWLTQKSSNAFVDQLVHDLQFARQQAILRNSLITLCPTLDQETCNKSSDWTSGYLILAETERLTYREVPQGTLSNSRQQIQFAPTGFSHSSNSTFVYILNQLERRIIINLQGRVRVE